MDSIERSTSGATYVHPLSPDNVLARLLDAAHHAPSVGFMQPWGFIVIRDREVRDTVHEIFERARLAAAQVYNDDRRAVYETLKLAGIREAPINLCVTCDEATVRGHGLGRQTMKETALYSTVCAVQNLWLAARAEGVGVGWVSILDKPAAQELLHLPPGVQLVAYLCVGYPVEFRPRPMLEEVGWKHRQPLADLVFQDKWGVQSPLFDPPGAG